MSDLEFFAPREEGEGYDPAAFERFKEKIKKNAKFIASLKRTEQKQKKTEDALLKILMQFFKTYQNQGIVLLAAKLLEFNIPAIFIHSIIILGNEELQKQTEFLRIEGQGGAPACAAADAETTEFSLVKQFADASLPLKVKAELNGWGRGLYDAAQAQPWRLLETALDMQANIKKPVIDCMANVLQNFLEKNGITNFSYETTFSFCEFLVHGILKKVKETLEKQKLVEGNLG